LLHAGKWRALSSCSIDRQLAEQQQQQQKQQQQQQQQKQQKQQKQPSLW
jgi:hypothetical protein